MADIIIELELLPPVELELTTQPLVYIEPTLLPLEIDPVFEAWLASEPKLSNFEDDGATTIKPKDSKTVDGSHLSGEITGGIFQP